MRTLRVANVNHICALPYRSLAQYEFIRYEENAAIENARKLHEGEVDLALISAAEFANHGGYVGLDFGVGCRERSDTMVLYAHLPLNAVSQVNLYSSASSSAVLLRVLLASFWKVSPALVRRSDKGLFDFVKGREAALVLHEIPRPLLNRFAIAEDLVKAWCAWTGKPYVSLVWAMRPGALRTEHLQFCNDIFHRSVRARTALAESYAEEFGISVEACIEHVTSVRDYYLDQTMLEGLDELFRRGESLGLLPAAEYRNATLTLLDRKLAGRAIEPPIDQILEGVVQGARLAIRDGVRLAYDAPLADLGMAAEKLRDKIGTSRRIEAVYELEDPPESLGSEGTVDDLLRQAVKGRELGFDRIRLPMLARFTGDITLWERLLTRMKSDGAVLIEGCTVFELRWIAALCRLPVEEVVRRLVKAGLDLVSGEGGEMLVDRVNADTAMGFLTVEDWLGTMKWVHHFGGKSNCVMRLSHHDSWEDRLLHLHKLRALQDETPGFTSIGFRTDPEWRRPHVAETRMRAVMLTRLFMDNVPSVQELEIASGADLSALLGLASGADSLRLVAGPRSEKAPREILDDLASVGLEFRPLNFDPFGGGAKAKRVG